jgi:hypothetical protein
VKIAWLWRVRGRQPTVETVAGIELVDVAGRAPPSTRGKRQEGG